MAGESQMSEPLPPAPPPLRRRPSWAARSALVAWIAMALGLGAALMALHEPLPLPDLSRLVGSSGYVSLHALAMQCPCSRRILDYLEQRGPRPEVRERLLLVDADEATVTRLRRRGFAVEPLNADTLSQRYHIEAAPLLVILRPDGGVAYAGAHTPRPQMAPVDLALLEQVRRGDHPTPLPVIGCALGRDLQRERDPFGLKYSLWRQP